MEKSDEVSDEGNDEEKKECECFILMRKKKVFQSNFDFQKCY